MSNYVTIPGFTDLTMQRMFDMAASHIATTRQKSENPINDRCAYSYSGCNASIFIREDKRIEMDYLEDSGWNYLVSLKFAEDHHSTFINSLQVAHDTAPSTGNFVEGYCHNMLRLAKKYKLDTTVLSEKFPEEFKGIVV